MKLCWVGFWDSIKEYGAYILETIKTGEPELRGFGATSDLAKLAAEIKQLVKQHPKEGIAIRYEPPGTDIVTMWGDGSITLNSAGKDFRALNPEEIAQFRKAFLEVQ
ncbi:hypothetical protein KJA16_01295 [Patescibacteria group bacterium]|nr:hypothetical protein [Patescibacteria group bacterium]